MPSRNVNRIAARYENRIAAALIKSFNSIRSKAKLKDLERILSTQGIQGAQLYINQLNIEGIIDKNITDELNEAVIKSGRLSYSVLPDAAIIDPDFRFNLLSYNASQFVRNYELSLIKDIGVNTRAAIQQSLQTDILAGVNPISTARNFRSAIGLTARQEQAVRNFERMLREGNKEVLTRALRDKRFDAAILRSIRDGKTIPNSKVNAMVKRYRERYIKHRSETIARTESLRAVSVGQHLSIMQAVEEGKIKGNELKRDWIYADDAKTRNAHRTIMNLNPDGVLVNQPFQTALGPLMYPRDPNGTAKNTINCRCAVVYRMVEDPPTKETIQPARSKPKPKRKPKERPEGYIPAKTLDELDDKMRKNSLGTFEFDEYNKYSKAQKLKIGNGIAQHADETLAKFPGIKKALDKQSLFYNEIIKGRDLASIRYAGASGLYSPRHLRLSVAGSAPKVHQLAGFGSNHLSFSGDIYANWRHELAHHIRSRMPNKEMGKFYKLFRQKGKDWFKRNVGRYAGTDSSEAFSECVSGYTSPKYGLSGPKSFFPKELEDLMKSLLEA